MKLSELTLTILFCAAAVVGYGQSPAKTEPDNTKVNKRDRNPGEVTADQQKANEADQELTQKIRRAIMADKSLSSYARNVKIISRDGSVTLKGPVKSENEKKSVLAKAVAAAGSAEKVTDEVSVKR